MAPRPSVAMITLRTVAILRGHDPEETVDLTEHCWSIGNGWWRYRYRAQAGGRRSSRWRNMRAVRLSCRSVLLSEPAWRDSSAMRNSVGSSAIFMIWSC